MPTEPGLVSTSAIQNTTGEPDLRTASVRALSGDRQLSPEDHGLDRIVLALAPAIFAIGRALVSEDPNAARRVTVAVFRTLVVRWRKLRARTLISVWLFQTALITAKRERRRLRLARTPSSPLSILLFRLNRLAPKWRDIVILRHIFEVPEPTAAAVLRLGPGQAGRREKKGLKRCQTVLRKTGEEAEVLFRTLVSQPATLPPDEVQEILRDVAETRTDSPLVQQTVASWRWIRFRAVVRRSLKALGAVACGLALLFATFVYLATHGYLTSFFIEMGQRQAFKNHPELRAPARPWPVTVADHALIRATPPATADELFQSTNIWPVKLTFTPEQWRHIKPSRVPPVREMFQNGRIILRNPKAKRSGLAGVLGFEFNWVEASLDFAGRHFDKVGVRYRGNGTYLNSLYGPKQSLKLDVNKFVKTNELAGIRELNFLNTIVDYSYLHDALAEELFRALGAVGPRTTYAYVTVEPGTGQDEPRGLFVALENIDGDFAQNRFGTRKAPIFKPVTYDVFEDLGDDWSAYEAIYDLKTKATDEQKHRLIEFAKLVSHASDDEFARKLPEYLDLDEFAGFLAGHVLLSSYDGFLVNGQNYYVYLDPRSNKIGFVPWDQDHSWGDFGHIGTTEQRENASLWQPSTYDFHFLKRVLKAEAFRTVYRQKLEQALAGPFSKETLYRKIDDTAQRIRSAVAAESDFRLKRFDQAVSSEWVPGPRDGPPEGPDAPIHQIKRFIENRVASVRAQLDGKSEGARMTGFR